MKYLIALLFFVIGINAQAQNPVYHPLDMNDDGLLIKTEIHQQPDYDKEEIYGVIKKWMAATFKDARSVTELDDKDNGYIVANGWQPVYEKVLGSTNEKQMWYTINISIKEGRYKVDIKNFKLLPDPIYGGDCERYFTKTAYQKSDGSLRKIPKQVHTHLVTVTNSINASLEKAFNNSESGVEDDW